MGKDWIRWLLEGLEVDYPIACELAVEIHNARRQWDEAKRTISHNGIAIEAKDAEIAALKLEIGELRRGPIKYEASNNSVEATIDKETP